MKDERSVTLRARGEGAIQTVDEGRFYFACSCAFVVWVWV